MGGPGDEDQSWVTRPRFGPPEREPPDRLQVIDEAIAIIGPSAEDLEACRSDIDDALNIIGVTATNDGYADRHTTKDEADAASKAKRALEAIRELQSERTLFQSLPMMLWDIDVEQGIASCQDIIEHPKRNARSRDRRQASAVVAAKSLLHTYATSRRSLTSTGRRARWPRLSAVLAGHSSTATNFERYCQIAKRMAGRSEPIGPGGFDTREIAALQEAITAKAPET